MKTFGGRNERINDFLTTLGIDEWTIDDFIEVLENQPNLAKKWLKDKEEKWHQRLYAFLSDDAYSFSEFPIVRCQDSQYRTGEECHFPIDDIEYKTSRRRKHKKNISTTLLKRFIYLSEVRINRRKPANFLKVLAFARLMRPNGLS